MATISLEVYDQTSLPPEDVWEARQILGQILSKAGVSINWDYCNVAATQPCSGVVQCPAVILHVIPQPRRGAHHVTRNSIGMTSLGRNARATVFTDRMRVVAEQSGVPYGLLLGYAIAHEIGHVFLGKADHGTAGIMRAHWGREDYEAMLRRWLTFAPGELRRIRQNVAFKSSGCRPLPVEKPGIALAGQ